MLTLLAAVVRGVPPITHVGDLVDAPALPLQALLVGEFTVAGSLGADDESAWGARRVRAWSFPAEVRPELLALDAWFAETGRVDSGARDRAARLAKAGNAAALEAARGLVTPFARSQGLARVARYAQSDAEVVAIAREAERALARAVDPWEAAAGLALPLAALTERACFREASALLERALAAAERVPHPVRRVDALFLLVQAGWSLPRAGPDAAVRRLVAVASRAQSGKTEAVLRDVVLMLAGAGRDVSGPLAVFPEGRARRQVERRLQEQAWQQPRPFFF
jgi:hypothetical protein